MKQPTFNHLAKDCPRCNGAGYFPRFRHIENGKCFRCKGSGFASFAKWLPIASIKKVEWSKSTDDLRAEVLFQGGQTKWLPIVAGNLSLVAITLETAMSELRLMFHKEHGHFFVPKNLSFTDNDCAEDHYNYDSYDYEEKWTDEDICNAAFDGHWDIYAHHCGY